MDTYLIVEARVDAKQEYHILLTGDPSYYSALFMGRRRLKRELAKNGSPGQIIRVKKMEFGGIERLEEKAEQLAERYRASMQVGPTARQEYLLVQCDPWSLEWVLNR